MIQIGKYTRESREREHCCLSPVAALLQSSINPPKAYYTGVHFV